MDLGHVNLVWHRCHAGKHKRIRSSSSSLAGSRCSHASDMPGRRLKYSTRRAEWCLDISSCSAETTAEDGWLADGRGAVEVPSAPESLPSCRRDLWWGSWRTDEWATALLVHGVCCCLCMLLWNDHVVSSLEVVAAWSGAADPIVYTSVDTRTPVLISRGLYKGIAEAGSVLDCQISIPNAVPPPAGEGLTGFE